MQKGYWEDGTVRQFEGKVIAVDDTPAEGKAVRFEKTYFYPASGGQLPDRGTVAGVGILDARQDDEGPFVILPHDTLIQAGQVVPCEVDDSYRTRHTQLHSAQHILSRLLEQEGARTLSFHMTEEEASIEISMAELSPEKLWKLEDGVEEIVRKCLPVETVFVDPSEMQEFEMRKVPELAGGPLRLVRIAGFDTNPCGGTHVRSTGEIGGFVLTHTDKVRGNLRLYFAAGLTATAFYRRQLQTIAQVEHQLTCGLTDILPAVTRLQEQEQSLAKQVKTLTGLAADELARGIRDRGEGVLVLEMVPGDLVQSIMRRLTDLRGIVCVVAYPEAGAPGQFMCTAPAEARAQLEQFCDYLKQSFGARMGGSGNLIRGKLEPGASVERLESFVAR